MQRKVLGVYECIVMRTRQRDTECSIRRYQVILPFVFGFWEATFLVLVSKDNAAQMPYLGQQPLSATLGFFWRTFDRERTLFCWVLWSHPYNCCWYVESSGQDWQLNASSIYPPSIFLAAWTAVMWAMTAMTPTLAAYPACPTAHRLSPGAMASQAHVFKRAMPRPPQVEDTREVRLAPSIRHIQCQLAAPAASPAHLALSSSKGWTWMTPTSSLVTWVTVTF